MQIDIGEVSLNYEFRGTGDGLVLIHGFSDNLGVWHNQVPVFSKHYQVLTYDFRGHGRTRTPDGEMTMAMHADDLAALLNAVEIERACVLGHSMGGRIALEFVLKYPERSAGLVMANMSAPSMGVTMSGKQAELSEKHVRMVTRLSESGDIEAITDELAAKSLSRAFQEQHPEICRKYKELKKQNDPKHYPALIQAMIKAMAMPPDLTLVACPALLIAGEHDPYMNLEVVAAMERDMAKAELKILPSGHAPAIETPEAFNTVVLDFLNSLT